jgi:hypothetical protein
MIGAQQKSPDSSEARLDLIEPPVLAPQPSLVLTPEPGTLGAEGMGASLEEEVKP